MVSLGFVNTPTQPVPHVWLDVQVLASTTGFTEFEAVSDVVVAIVSVLALEDVETVSL